MLHWWLLLASSLFVVLFPELANSAQLTDAKYEMDMWPGTDTNSNPTWHKTMRWDRNAMGGDISFKALLTLANGHFNWLNDAGRKTRARREGKVVVSLQEAVNR
jgi:hypothetical protein